MADKKYQVFISSTYSDLIEERRKILDILLMADCIPAGMEAFVATDKEQFEVIKKVINLCDYYVLIIGKRYGSVHPDTGLSYTEMEYNYAKEHDIPVLVFAIDDSVDLPDDRIEHDKDKIGSLMRFRTNAMSNRLASIWKTSDELTGRLAVAIMMAKTENIRPGWQRATDYDEAMLRRQIMDLQNQNNDLIKALDDAQQTITSFTTQNNVAFNGCTVKIDYIYYYGNDKRKASDSKEIMLPQLFSIIATEMMDVALTESAIENILKKKLFTTSYNYYFNDAQLIKRLLNQLKALGLIYSYWSNEKSTLFWGLTPKGCKVRDDMILIREH
jgi:hypothetical protein